MIKPVKPKGKSVYNEAIRLARDLSIPIEQAEHLLNKTILALHKKSINQDSSILKIQSTKIIKLIYNYKEIWNSEHPLYQDSDSNYLTADGLISENSQKKFDFSLKSIF